MKKVPYILRFTYASKKDGRKTRGWFVKIVNNQLVVRKLFSDGLYGGSKKAMEAAVLFRDDKLREARHVPAVPIPN